MQRHSHFRSRMAYALAATAVSVLTAFTIPATAGATGNSGPVPSSQSHHVQQTGQAKGVSPDSPNGEADCDQGWCIWEDAWYGSTLWEFVGTGGGGSHNYNQWYYVGSSENDQASSMYNNRPSGTAYDRDYPVNGDYVACIDGYNDIADLVGLYWDNGGGVNDSISAFDLTNSSC